MDEFSNKISLLSSHIYKISDGGNSMRKWVVWIVVSLFLLPGCLDSSDTESSNLYDVSVIQEGTATDNLDLIVVLQLDTPGASIAFTDIYIDLGKAMGCTQDAGGEDCDFAEQGDMDGLWEEGEGLEIYETSNWCDSTCTEVPLDIFGFSEDCTSEKKFDPWRMTIQMQ